MKAIVIETDGKIYPVDLRKPLYQSASRILEGYFEIVRPRGLARPYCFLANETGLLQGLPRNGIGSWLYQSHIHGHPIAGNIILLKESRDDLVGLDPAEIVSITAEMSVLREFLAAEKLFQEGNYASNI